MNLRQVIITSIITLIVTAISGVFVNWYTKNNIEIADKKDNLFYKIVNISEFKSDSTKISLLTLEVFNNNKDKNTNIEFSVQFSDKANILDVITKNPKTEKEYLPVKKTSNKLIFNLPALFPEEKIKINIAVKNLSSTPKILLQSNETLGKEYTNIITKETNTTVQYLKVALVTVLLLSLIFFIIKIIPNIKGYQGSLNNTAFLFLHNRRFDISNKLLLKKIEDDGATSFELSNLATTEYFLYNDFERATSLLKMASYIAFTTQTKFVLTFNEFIILASEKNYLEAKERLELCNKLKNKELKKYIDFSLILKELKLDQTIENMMEQIIK